jgi:hypothetical protein
MAKIEIKFCAGRMSRHACYIAGKHGLIGFTVTAALKVRQARASGLTRVE